MNQTEIKINRRGILQSWLTASTTVALSGITLSGITLAETERTASPKNIGASGSSAVRPSRPDRHHVRMTVEARGNVMLADNPLASRDVDLRMPMTANATLEYEEQRFEDAVTTERIAKTSGPQSTTVGSVRYYHQADVQTSVGKQTSESKLRDTMRVVQVRRDTGGDVIHCEQDYLQRSELELLQTPINCVDIERWVQNPERLQAGQTYRLDAPELLSVIDLSWIDQHDVQMKVASVEGDKVKLQIKGSLDGSIAGVMTQMRLSGKLTYHLDTKTCQWLAMAIHETRQVGLAEPGFDVVATIKVVREPLARKSSLVAKHIDRRESEIARSFVTDVPAEQLYVELQSERLGFATMLNRDWRVMSDVPGATMLRAIRDDSSIAQCDVRPLAAMPEGRQWTLEAFGEDVKRTLGDQLDRMIKADQRISASGLRVLRVTATGRAADVPIHWVFLHFSDDSGRRMLSTFTMQSDQAERFAASDLEMAESTRFTDAAGTIETITEPKASISRKKTDAELQSASDLR